MAGDCPGAEAVLTVLVRHDTGCKWGREGTTAEIDADGTITGYKLGQGHSDAAKRLSDTFNLHHAAGITSGWIAVRYADGSGGDEIFDTREDAVRCMWPWEDRYFYCTLAAAPSMTVCAAASVLRWKRVMSEVEKPARDFRHAGP